MPRVFSYLLQRIFIKNLLRLHVCKERILCLVYISFTFRLTWRCTTGSLKHCNGVGKLREFLVCNCKLLLFTFLFLNLGREKFLDFETKEFATQPPCKSQKHKLFCSTIVFANLFFVNFILLISDFLKKCHSFFKLSSDTLVQDRYEKNLVSQRFVYDLCMYENFEIFFLFLSNIFLVM